jgi:hypothetical protein
MLRWAAAPAQAKVEAVWEGPFSRENPGDRVVLMSGCPSRTRDKGNVGLYVPGPSDEPSRLLAVGDECGPLPTGTVKRLVCRELSYQGDSDVRTVKVLEPATSREHVLVTAKSTVIGVCDPSWKDFAVDIDSLKYTVAGPDNPGRMDVHVRYRRALLESLHADRACQAAKENADVRMLVDKLGELRTMNLSFKCTEARCQATDPSVASKWAKEGWIELSDWR